MAGGTRVLADSIRKRPVGQEMGWERREMLSLNATAMYIKVLYAELKSGHRDGWLGAAELSVVTMQKEMMMQS
jgi:hypothetical protein